MPCHIVHTKCIKCDATSNESIVNTQFMPSFPFLILLFSVTVVAALHMRQINFFRLLSVTLFVCSAFIELLCKIICQFDGCTYMRIWLCCNSFHRLLLQYLFIFIYIFFLSLVGSYFRVYVLQRSSFGEPFLYFPYFSVCRAVTKQHTHTQRKRERKKHV